MHTYVRHERRFGVTLFVPAGSKRKVNIRVHEAHLLLQRNTEQDLQHGHDLAASYWIIAHGHPPVLLLRLSVTLSPQNGAETGREGARSTGRVARDS